MTSIAPVPAVPASLTNGIHLKDPGAEAVLEKYRVEHSKRIRSDGQSQYVFSPLAESYREFFKDIWVDDSLPDPGRDSVKDGSYHEFLILGAGYAGLSMAARLRQIGVDANDIRLVDSAGGFGGTWWFNRYPGLMCDVESYIYLPLLEELDYMPKHKYSYSPELRRHAERMAERYDLVDKALFQARLDSTTWDESTKRWTTKVVSTKNGEVGREITVHSRFVVLAGGPVNLPKVPRLRNLEAYKGHMFHTARWDYKYTGGTEEKPDLTNLRDKSVAIIGTGATAIQVVPELAKWAKQLYVFQRTPSGVDVRGQCATDPTWWEEKVRSVKGWQEERLLNFASFFSLGPLPEMNLVDDGWTHFRSYTAMVGCEDAPTSPEQVEAYVGRLHAVDLPRQERVRARVDEIVKDKATAADLKAWYPSWCKRPCFHDEYLQSFNEPNVKLVHTDGRGIDTLTENGVYSDGKEYPVDVIIFSTGYDIAIGMSPAGRSSVKVTGRNGVDLDDKWAHRLATLHGCISNGFPNLFFPGLSQIGGIPSQSLTVDHVAQHIAWILQRAARVHGGSRAFTIEPTVEAEEAWSQKIAAGAIAFTAAADCLPSYFNREGDLMRKAQESPETLKNFARAGFWSKGFLDFLRELDEWKTSRPLEGVEVTLD
ncbi:hypothetical protein Z517_06499 [Fonsecaea pedrosoi CBS 271.37]|uniref:Uncharacterized protein n=1 Tax=Fonsecaea pedrosoi CBS 271.37 TaxID=1442368 RepID=A0A0D2H5E6_9EURO|nr:uncharacterized protein Z517_06499 [Fonsecaea pedrosoi CBS 271.37]KIW79884.1 hypothetical protein Z517_06499 [Fonsecaea pedrosoi CBS 271.37]